MPKHVMKLCECTHVRQIMTTAPVQGKGAKQFGDEIEAFFVGV